MAKERNVPPGRENSTKDTHTHRADYCETLLVVLIRRLECDVFVESTTGWRVLRKTIATQPADNEIVIRCLDVIACCLVFHAPNVPKRSSNSPRRWPSVSLRHGLIVDAINDQPILPNGLSLQNFQPSIKSLVD